MLNFSELLQENMNKLKQEAQFRQLGLSPEESLRMAFGEPAARKAFDDLATIAAKQEIENKK